MKVHNFRDSMIVGKKGEEIIYNYLSSLPDVVEIEDVRNIREYQLKDIDFILIMENNTKRSVEIKTDSYISENIFFETMSSKETNSIGCMYKTQANWLLYYFLKTGELYILKMPEYRNWVDENISRFQKKKIANFRGGKGAIYTSEGRLVPKQILEEEFENLTKILMKEEEK